MEIVNNMCKMCLNSNTHLVSNDDDGYHCICACKVKDVEFTVSVFTYNTEQNYSTNLICKKCNHYVVIRYGQRVMVRVIE